MEKNHKKKSLKKCTQESKTARNIEKGVRENALTFPLSCMVLSLLTLGHPLKVQDETYMRLELKYRGKGMSS